MAQQICITLSESAYNEVVTRAKAEKKTKARVAAELVTYALIDVRLEIEQLNAELEHRNELLNMIREELGFVRQSYSVLETSIARPLALLLSAATSETGTSDLGDPSETIERADGQVRRGWRDRLLRK
jgi:hypothetical protein